MEAAKLLVLEAMKIYECSLIYTLHSLAFFSTYTGGKNIIYSGVLISV